MFRLRGAIVVAVACSAGMVGSPADAAQPTSVQQVELGSKDGGAALLPMNVEGMYPGGPASVMHLVLRRSENLLGGTFVASLTDVRDLERGCGRAETREGDTSCGEGDDQGELSQQLVGLASWSTDLIGCDSAVVAGPSARAFRLDDAALPAPAELAREDAVCLSLELTLPRSADNLVQSDLVQFSLRLALSGSSPNAGVLDSSLTSGDRVLGVNGSPTGTAEDVASGSAARALPDALPFTGIAGQFLFWIALASLLVGTLLVGTARRPGSRRS